MRDRSFEVPKNAARRAILLALISIACGMTLPIEGASGAAPGRAAAARQSPAPATGSLARPVSLHGAQAISHLQQEGTYDSLVTTFTRAQYAIRPVDGARRSDGEDAYEAVNPARDLRASFTGSAIRDHRGREVATYDHLRAWDATGRELTAKMAVRKNRISLEVDDRNAQYPIVVDPLVWQEVSRPTGVAAAHDLNGYAVAISGDTVIVGSYHDQFSGTGGTVFDTKGKAYVFVRKSTPWTAETTWEHQATLEPLDGSHTAQYGSAVAISGDTALVGDPTGTLAENFPGSVYIFVRSGIGWTFHKRIKASDPFIGSQFGYSVAISGETAVVGAPFDGRFVSTTAKGKAYVFTRDAGSWNEKAQLEASDGTREDYFGISVAISGNTIVAGAYGHDVVNGLTTNEDQGAAYVFVGSDTTWPQEAKLVGSIGAPSDGFGISVGVSRNIAVGGSSAGIAYVFGRSGTDWTEQQILAADDSHPNDGFGTAVAVSGRTIVVGASRADIDKGNVIATRQGAAYLFHRDATAWKQQDKLTADNGQSNDGFGFSVAIGGVGLIVGAPGHDVDGRSRQGDATIFQQLDSDADGLPDEWEKKGVTIEGSFIDLPKMGAQVLHKDVFVHADWMATGPNGAVLKPSARAIKMVTDAFAASPVTNPDGKKGVRLHVDLGPDSIMNPSTGAKWGTLSRAGQVPFQEALGAFGGPPDFPYDWHELDDVKATTFDAFHRDTVFHYGLFCNTLPDVLLLQRPIRGHARSTPSADFVVALGAFKRANGTVFSTPLQQALTFMHELGHNLGLGHGGGDDDNFKPNYLSIMNYRFDSTGLLIANKKQRKLDYSRAKLPTLNETNLNEAVGISDPTGHLTTWNPLTGDTTLVTTPPGFNQCLTNPGGYWKIFLPGPALDWDCNGMLTPVTNEPLVADLNSDGRCIAHGEDANGESLPLQTTQAFLQGDDEIRANFVTSGADRICQTPKHGVTDIPLQAVGWSEPDELVGFNDWSALKFDGGGRIGASLGENDSDPTSTPLDESPVERFQEDVPAVLLAEDAAAPLDEVSYAPAEGPAALTVDFDGSASTATTGTIVEWAWDFGDGAIGTGATVVHTYTAPGEYFASLTVTDDSGNVNLAPLLHLVTVADPPSPTPTSTTTPLPGATATRTPTPAPTATPTRTATGTPGTGSGLTPTPGPTTPPPVTPTPLPTQTPATSVGSVDRTFDPTVTSVYGRYINAVVPQPDHKIIVGGDFESFAGCARRNLARINADGSCDSTFDPGLELTTVIQNVFGGGGQIGPSTQRVGLVVHALALQADGKIVVGMAPVPGFRNGVFGSSKMIVRLNADGTLDPSFEGPASSFVTTSLGRAFSRVLAIAIQPNGKMIVGGSFTQSDDTTVALRLNADGSVDGSFHAPTTPYGGVNASQKDYVQALALQSDGKIVIGGFLNRDIIPRPAVARLNSDGSLDTGYNAPIPPTGRYTSEFASISMVYALALQADGKMLVAGGTEAIGGTSPAGLARLNTDGSRDTGFADWRPSSIFGLALQADQKILIGSDFRITMPAVRNSIARLNPDGTLDPTFDTPGMRSDFYAVNGTRDVSGIAVQAGGKIVAVGRFDNYANEPAEGIVQLEPNGDRDPAFDSNGPGSHGHVFALVRQPDGKLLVGLSPSSLGRPTHLNGERRGGIGRLHADGTTDTGFTSPFGYESTVYGIAVQSDGKVIVGGSLRFLGSTTDFEFARLNADGTLDAGFVLPGPGTHLGNRAAFTLQGDGKILANEVNDFNQRRLARLNTDGTPDETFSVPLSGGAIEHILLQPDGKILLTGLVPGNNGQYAGLTRLNADGTPDPTFDPGTGPDFTVSSILLQPDGKIIIGGLFFSYDGTARDRIARVNADGSLDPSFLPTIPYAPYRVGALALAADGKIVVGLADYELESDNERPNRVFRLNPDGSLDDTLPQDGSGIEGGDVNALLLDPDGGIVLGGEFAALNGVARMSLARLVGQSLPAAVDAFVFYKVKTTKGAPKFAPLGPLTLADAVTTTDVDVQKLAALGIPANANDAGISDAVTHLTGYALKQRKGGPKFRPIPDVRVQNPCGELVVTVTKPQDLLVPTLLNPPAPASPPAAETHEVADFRCYRVKLQKKRADGTTLAAFPKRAQIEAGDTIQARRYDLKKLTRICFPVAESGAPVVLKTGEPIDFTPAALRHETLQLACYQVKAAKKTIAQNGCGPIDPKDKGAKIIPAPPKHQKQSGLRVISQLGTGTLDTAKELELCIPSTVTRF